MPTDMEQQLIEFIAERHAIYVRRKQKDDAPWTKDPILKAYRFCNVYRELDKVTLWIARNWREPNENDLHLWFAMLVARYVNEPSTLKLIGYPVPFNANALIEANRTQKAKDKNTFNAAYIISTGGQSIPKAEYLTSFFKRMWDNRSKLHPSQGMTLTDYNARLVATPGIGSFMSGQIIADLKYTGRLRHATDWWSFAASGPGSRRGLNRVRLRPVKQGWKEAEWFDELSKLRTVVNKDLIIYSMPKLHGQDMQNCLCEFDKYERARLGEGRPKQKFLKGSGNA